MLSYLLTSSSVEVLSTATKILNYNGISVGDSFETSGRKKELFQVEASVCALPYLHEFPSAKIFHLINHPLADIEFAVNSGWFSSEIPKTQLEQFFYAQVWELTGPYSQISRACLWQIAFNNRIKQEASHLRYFPIRVGLDDFQVYDTEILLKVAEPKFDLLQIDNRVLRNRMKEECAKFFGSVVQK